MSNLGDGDKWTQSKGAGENDKLIVVCNGLPRDTGIKPRAATDPVFTRQAVTILSCRRDSVVCLCNLLKKREINNMKTQYYCPLDQSKLVSVPGGIHRCGVCAKHHPDRDPYFSEEFLKGYAAGYNKAVRHLEKKIGRMHKYIRAGYDFKSHKLTDKGLQNNGI
jgi:hypothetical protein